jgi:hypothetical protein
MGRSKIEITATGNHGCDRDAQPGDTLTRCTSPGCIDCRALDFVDQLKDGGASFDTANGEGATLTHWPDMGDGAIVDDLLEGKRRKNAFRPPAGAPT